MQRSQHEILRSSGALLATRSTVFAMSQLAATQISKPADEQAFERASVVLWSCILDDPTVQKVGRRGQGQDGVDLVGMRDGDPRHLVGVQCKLKAGDRKLTAAEVREELGKALGFEPALREYYITTTAADDAAMQKLARQINVELADQERELRVFIWGWNTLEEHIVRHKRAIEEFDPAYSPFGRAVVEKTEAVFEKQVQLSDEFQVGVATILTEIRASRTPLDAPPGDATISVQMFGEHLDAQVDGLRDLITVGKPQDALPLLESLLDKVRETASGRILFRITANIASCRIAMGDEEGGIPLLLEAYEHAPEEPKAVANKAYALILRGAWKELAAFGAEALKADPTNEVLAGYLVQGARHDPSVTDPLALVPEGLRASEAVTIAHVFFLRHRDDPAWRDAARKALEAFPDDEHAQQFAADADLDDIIQDRHFQRTHLLTPDQKARLAEAIGILTRLWDKARNPNGKVAAYALGPCANLIAAHTIDGNFKKALEVARQGLAVAPDDQGLLLRAAIAAVEAKDDWAGELLAKLPPSPDVRLLAFRHHSARGDWEDVARFADLQPGDIPECDREMVQVAARLARIRLSGDDPRELLAAIIAGAKDNPRACVVASAYAREHCLDDLSEEAYGHAVSGIRDDTHIADRLMVAMQAISRHDWPRVADLLDGWISEDSDGEMLRAVAAAYVNVMPVREQAVRFFERLPAAVMGHPYYLNAAGMFHFNRGDLDRAETWLRKAADAAPDVENCLALCATLRRKGRRDQIPGFLASVKVEELKGAPGQKMGLAQIMHEAGFSDRTMAYAYDVLRRSPNDQEAASRYLGLILFDRAGRLIPSVTEAGVGTWVRLEREEGKPFAFLIEEGKDRPAQGIVSPRHALAAQTIGLKVGDTFVQESHVGEGVTWRVAELKHKYLHALHDIMENFETRFPDAQGFYTMTVRDGEIEKTLEQVRKFAETNRTLADFYLEQRLPMALVASLMGGDTAGFADYIRSLDKAVVACTGLHSERNDAYADLDKRRAAGVVLDTYAAWLAAMTDTFDVLEAVFGKLVLARATIDDLRMKKERDELLRAGSLTVAWHDGEFVKLEHTQESIDERVRYVRDQIAKIEQHCAVLPVQIPDKPSEVAEVVLARFDPHVLDAAYLAADGYMLLSEDLYYRRVATEATGAHPGVWLQIVLAYARDKEIISLERYGELMVQLAWCRHRHLFLDPKTLASVLVKDDTPRLDRLRALAQFLGTEDADMMSHLSVLDEFLKVLWKASDVGMAKKRMASGILLEQIVRNQGELWSFVVGYLRVDARSGFRDYAREWLRGHFLPEEQVVAREAELRAMTERVDRRLRAPRRRRGRAAGRSKGGR
ncbi:restriction endonuclease [Microvirga sp. 2YAF29]|uniref:PIN domain-containing protein n=1 Tax=Microvirga sp. 2YAF29 TaxID=3233031 RepID=UPI003F9D5C50